MKIFVTGANGQLGYDVIKEAKSRGYEVIKSDIQDNNTFDLKYIRLDITNEDDVMRILKDYEPDVVIHCAAWTNVDKAELAENLETVMNINAIGTRNIAVACKAIDAKMIYISTDYVFGENKQQLNSTYNFSTFTRPHKPDDKDFYPVNVYGYSKLEGEFNIISSSLEKYFIVRTSWVYGINGINNFPKSIIKAGKSHDKLSVVYDQIGNPTYTVDLARLLIDMSESDKYGIYHATNSGQYISWYKFAKQIFKEYGINVKVNPITTEEYNPVAKRPYNSRLDKRKLKQNGFKKLPHWKNALRRYIEELKNEGDLI